MNQSCPSHFHKRPWFRKWILWRRLTGFAFLTLLVLGQFDWFPWLKGNTSGTTLLGLVPITDPLAALELLIATHSLTTSVVIGAGILLFVAAMLGPVFCGYVCPFGLILDINHSLRRSVRKHLLRKTKLVPVTNVVPHWLRYVLLGLLVGFALVTRLPVFQALSPINLLVRALVMGSLIGLSVVGTIVVLEWFLPRVWCRALCPLGATYSIVGRKAFWRVRINPKTAGQIRCQQCQIRCPMGIKVMSSYTLAGRESVTHPSCIRCGDCIDICPNTVLGLKFHPFSSPQSAQDGPEIHLRVLESDQVENANSTGNACD